ncbi:MAG: DUF5110 domain-containing protein [Hymenobacter sp.]|nr:DUF5110 domain-containing protein [Hymenobacter sp.]
MTPYVPTTARYHADSLRVRYYADPAAGPTSFTVYDDDGQSGLTGRIGAYELLAFTGRTTNTQADIRIVPGGNGYQGAPAWRSVELLLPRVAAAPSAVVINGETVPTADWQYEAATSTLRLHLLLMRQPVTVSVRGLRLRTAATPAPPQTLTLEAPDNRTFGGGTQLHYTLHRAGQTGPLRIFNAAGQLVRTLAPATAAGSHRLTWNADDAQNRPVPGGVYWAELAGQRQRLVLLR